MKVAVIGAGRMGLRHIQIIREMGLELAGVCDLKVEALALAQKEQSVPEKKQYIDAVKLLEQTHPECVIIATTAQAHCEYVCSAVEHGAKFILCEKTMAVSLEECERMISCCNKAGVALAINHPMRFMERYVEAKKIIQDTLGGLASVTVVAGNFGMAMNGTHYFEMFRYITDEAPGEVTAWFSDNNVPNPRGEQFHDCAGSVRITTQTGKRCYLEAGYDQGHGLQVVYAGRYGQLVIDELAGLMRWVARQEQYRSLPTTRYGMPWVEYTRKIAPADVIAPSKAVLKALLEKDNYPTGEQGYLAVKTLVAAYISNENAHSAIAIDGRLPYSRVFPWA